MCEIWLRSTNVKLMDGRTTDYPQYTNKVERGHRRPAKLSVPDRFDMAFIHVR